MEKLCSNDLHSLMSRLLKTSKSLLVMKSKEIHEKKDKRVENWKVKKTDISLNAEIVSLEQDEISLTLFS